MKRKLHRGLDALLSEGAKSVLDSNLETAIVEATTPTTKPGEAIAALPVDLLQRGQYQPRRDFDPESLEELAASIKAQGLIQPIIVRPIAGARYEIIAGERRWRASQLAGLSEIPAIIRKIEDKPAMAIALIENMQREDLNPLEEANALQRLQTEFELTHEQVSDAVGKSRVAVTNLLRLLKLNPDVKILLQHGDIQMGHARALLGLEGQQQSAAARLIVAKHFSVREAEALVRKFLTTPKVASSSRRDPNVIALERRLSEILGSPVSIAANANGKGKIEISFASLEQLEGILERIEA